MRFLLLITPAGGEAVFREFGEPAALLNLPPPQEPPSEDFMLRLLARDAEFGIVYAE